VLLGSIPTADDQDEARGDSAFEETLKSTDDHQVRPVLGGSDAKDTNSP